MKDCMRKIITAIYGDERKSGCPRCLLLGILVAFISVTVGFTLAISSTEGSIGPWFYLIGLVITGVGLLLAIILMPLAFLSESWYKRILIPHSLSTTPDNSEMETSSTLTTEQQCAVTTPVPVSPNAPKKTFHHDKRPSGTDSSDSFTVLEVNKAPVNVTPEEFVFAADCAPESKTF